MKILPFIRLHIMLLAIISVSMIIPLVCAIACNESAAAKAFALPFCVCFIAGIIFLIAGRKQKITLSARSGFAVVALCWITASFLGAVPFVLSGTIPSATDAFFESVSGFTTTGATVLSDVENLPRSINVWRTEMHWLGGMGIVALTVALFPVLGVGGFQLIKAETTGPEKGKITSKITDTAKILWFIYLGFTAVQTVFLMIAGMDFIDALSYSFSTLGTGGFATKNASIGAYNSAAVDWICTVFMLLAGVNFSLYYRLILGKGKELLHNTELKAYIGIVVTAVCIAAAAVLPQYKTLAQSLRYASFQVASFITTTGFSTADYAQWAPAAQMALFLLMFVGGCSGSTSGNIKVVRWVVLAKQMTNETNRMLHPHGVFSIRLNGRAGRKDIVYSVSAFIFLYLMLVLVTGIVAAFDGADLLTSFSTALTLVGNIGVGFGKTGSGGNFQVFSAAVKWWFCFAMIAGRLELYTMFVFFFPSFWKKR
ncbi:MAG: TrkH family potassium uptake protein [Bacteroides sp.]|nr:TrkH family potassium uptake protein [Prevotella sp.]MCM1408833.1 TrkH family potassium uptake protein [Treponema brennaborense]MCM1470613.1 TrkH family potassium uptake protein [Bacteroides sp.]